MELKVKVVTRAKRKKVKLEDGVYKVYLTAIPVDNKANEQLIEVLADFFDVGKKDIFIIRGHKSRQKIIRVMGR